MNVLKSSISMVAIILGLYACGDGTKKTPAAASSSPKIDTGSELALIYCDEYDKHTAVTQSPTQHGCVERPVDVVVPPINPIVGKGPYQSPNQVPYQVPRPIPQQIPIEKCADNCATPVQNCGYVGCGAQTYPSNYRDPYQDGYCKDIYCGFNEDRLYMDAPWQGQAYYGTPHSGGYDQCYNSYGGHCNGWDFLLGFMVHAEFRIEFSFFGHVNY